MSGMVGTKAAQLRVLEAQAALAQAELDLAREARGPEAARGVIFLRLPTDATPGRAIPLGETAVVLTPGRARVFLDGWPDESRIIHDAAGLRDFCEGIITDPRWFPRPSSNPQPISSSPGTHPEKPEDPGASEALAQALPGAPAGPTGCSGCFACWFPRYGKWSEEPLVLHF